MKDGILIIHKGQNITSQGVVNRLKRLYGVKKAGHTGTLDPMATGVLPVLIGRAVKASEFMLTSTKCYKAELTLGVVSDTEDIFGNLTKVDAPMPSEEEVLSALASFRGKILQTPPMYSALKVGGKKLCDLAREGIEIAREAREITIYRLEGERIAPDRYRLSVECSKGTYIRTLCADIGRALGTGGVMSALCRSEASGFSLADAHTIEEIERMTDEEKEGLILPVETIFEKYERVSLPAFFEKLARAGLEIYEKKIGKSFPVGTRVRLYGEDGFFALGEVREYEEGLAIKPIRQF
ncbi:MAG: tRNA pseudouridine(55) synthase TruB [Clostridia bacterium]|nr:tRNA pseudouridine(55) synthase TruB [Clostridia bacterium]